MLRSEVFLVAAGRIGNALILLASLRVMTALLEPAEYGLLALLTAFQSFAGLILINPVGHYLNRHTHEWHDDGSLSARVHTLSRYWLVAGGVTGVMAAGWFALTRPSQFAVEYVFVGLGVWLTIYAITEQNVAVSRLNMLGFRRNSVLWQLAATALGLLFSSLLVSAQPSALAWLAGQGLGTWVCYFGAKRALRKVAPAGAVAQDVSLRALFLRHDFKKFCLPLAAVTVLLWLEGNGYRFVLEREWSPEMFAFFVLGLSVPAQMSALMESFIMQIIYPYFFRGVSGEVDAEQKRRAVSSMIDALLPLYLLWAAFLMVGSPYALQLIADPKYHGATAWLIFGASVELARLTGSVWQFVAQAEKDFSPMMGPFAVGTFGALGAALASAMFGLSPATFASLLVAALFAKAAAIIMAMRARMTISIAQRRVALAASVLVLIGFASTQLPVAVGPLPALVYLVLAFIVVAIPMVIHVKTSPAVKFLFSLQLRGER